MITERVQRLLDRLKVSSQRVVCNEAEQASYARIVYKMHSTGEPLSVIKFAEFLDDFAHSMPIEIIEDELIKGSQRFTRPNWRKIFTEEELSKLRPFGNIGHICVDYGRFISRGIRGLREDITSMADNLNKKAFEITLNAFSVFVRRHGCEQIAEFPPESFHNALQLVWFIHVFLHAECNSAAISFGRFDKYLGPYLDKDLESGHITKQEAYELLCCFCIKCCEGDESQNLTLGKEDSTISLMMLKVMSELKIWQPSISVRIEEDTSEKFWKAAVDLCSTGLGMPSFFNGKVVTSSLEAVGIPHDRADDWGIVGCYESAPMGDCYPLTVAGGFVLPEMLWLFLQEKDDYESFEDFYSGFKIYFQDYYQKNILSEFEQKRQSMKEKFPSPFESICVTGCIESGLNAEEGGAHYNLFGVNVLGIGSLVDSLLSIKELIFTAKDLKFKDMIEQLTQNFPDRKLLLRCRNLPDKFGTDSLASNYIAEDISNFIANEILSHPLSGNVRPYPGFFWFGNDININFMAGPDGRVDGERISYGCGPGVVLENTGVTTILNSAACIAHSLCACGNPLTISLSTSDIAGEEGRERIQQLVKCYFQKGGYHLHINVVDAEELEKAKVNPEQYPELVVRVSGYSAPFVDITENWQDAIIERTKRNM